VAEVQEAEPEAEEALESEGGRDPFKTQAGSLQSAASPGPSTDLRLVGIVMEKGDKPMGIFRSGRKRYYASVGERAGGYRVVGIGENHAVLEQDGRQVRLVLRPPPPEE
jgi:hypothetical protein